MNLRRRIDRQSKRSRQVVAILSTKHCDCSLWCYNNRRELPKYTPSCAKFAQLGKNCTLVKNDRSIFIIVFKDECHSKIIVNRHSRFCAVLWKIAILLATSFVEQNPTELHVFPQ